MIQYANYKIKEKSENYNEKRTLTDDYFEELSIYYIFQTTAENVTFLIISKQ